MKDSVATMKAHQNSKAISQLRSQAESIARTDEELKTIRKLLHEPTLLLREGSDTVHVESVISNIENELDSMRSYASVS